MREGGKSGERVRVCCDVEERRLAVILHNLGEWGGVGERIEREGLKRGGKRGGKREGKEMEIVRQREEERREEKRGGMGEVGEQEVGGVGETVMSC